MEKRAVWIVLVNKPEQGFIGNAGRRAGGQGSLSGGAAGGSECYNGRRKRQTGDAILLPKDLP